MHSNRRMQTTFQLNKKAYSIALRSIEEFEN